MEREEETWLEECDEPEKKRRRGHEKDSQYDKLMDKWVAIWNGMLQKHWQFMVETGEEQVDLVPEEFKAQIKVPKPHYEYDGAKLERVVQAAMERAREAGKHDLAAAVEQVYKDALQDTKLRVLLEAILTQRADRQQNEEFQGYVKLAKAKIREQKEQKIKQDAIDAAAKGAVKPANVPAPTQPQQAPAATPASLPAANAPPTPAATQLPVPAQVPAKVTLHIPAQVPAPVPAQVSTPATVNAATSVKTAPVPKALPAAVSSTQPPSASKAGKTTTPKKTVTKTKLPGNPKITPNKAKSQAHVTVQAEVTTITPAQSSSSVSTQPKVAQDNVVTTPRFTAILGDLQFAQTAQQILRGAPDIDDSRLQALKSTLINHPETKTDFGALAARLEKETSTGPEPQAVAGASRPVRANAGKRRRTSAGASAMAEAADEDLLQAQRAAKRRRGEMGEDDGGDYHPVKAVRDKSRKKKKSDGRPSNSQSGETSLSRDTSPLSDLSEMDIESTKSAYVDELVRRRTDEQARNDIVEQYGPVSPTDAGDGDEDWASMASPTLGPMQIDDGHVDDGQLQQLTQRVPSPPAEPAPAENDALRLISGATAQAVAKDPGIGRLEAKLDTLITASESRAANGQTAHDMNAANTETLKEIATVLNNADVSTTRPEFVRLVLQLTTNAAEAAIHSAEAAKKAGEMARDVSLMLQQLGVKGAADDHPATPLSEN